ncbi:MAG: cyclase family protein [bacterium]|nr:cyclase family protein [Candidatus Sumerlaeota bacterium]
MKAEHLIDLSRRIIPGKEHFKFTTRVDDVTNILPEVKHRPDIWYILGEMTMCTHIGTHIEVPFHHWKEGADTADFPISKLIAPCVCLDFSNKKDGDTITLSEVKKHDARIRAGDVVFIRQDMDKLYDSDRWNEQAHLSIEANQWLVDKGIACLGTDAAGLEVPGTDYQPNHIACCKAGIPMIESLTNLELLGEERHLVIILPLPIEGLDACPVRVAAIKKGGLDWQ